MIEFLMEQGRVAHRDWKYNCKALPSTKSQKKRGHPWACLAALASSNKGKKRKVTLGSRLVSHASTNSAQRCLTSLIGREAVFPTWYEPCMNVRCRFFVYKPCQSINYYSRQNVVSRAAEEASQAIAYLAAGNKSKNDSDEENVDADASNAGITPAKSPKNKRDEEPARNIKRSKAREPEAFSDKEGDSFEEAAKSPGRAAPSKRETLFSKISTSASAIASVSKQLVKSFQSNSDKGIADILCLVVESAGLPSSKVSIKAKDIQSSDPADFCEELCQNIKDGELSTQFSNRPKNVKSNVRNFWLKFMREAEPLLTENEGLIFQLHEWLSTLSSSKLLSLRLAATEASLLVVTGLAKAAGTVASSGTAPLHNLFVLLVLHFMFQNLFFLLF